MSARATTCLAWSLWALAVALTALGLLLLLPNLAFHVYDYWLENTLGAALYATVGAVVASRRPENAVGWLLCLYGLAYGGGGHFSSQYAIYSLLAQPGSLPGGQGLAWISSWILPQLAIVASTLAALFNPLRKRLREFIDKRFYRSKYDAAKTLEEFGTAMREATDLDALTEEVTGVIHETLQPAHGASWLAPASDREDDD